MNEISNLELLDELDELVPQLVQIRDRIDTVMLQIKLFRTDKAVNKDKVRLRVIIRTIEKYYNFKLEDLWPDDRTGDKKEARHIFCAMAKNMTGLSLPGIGAKIKRDHTTVLNSIKAVNNARDTSDILYDHDSVIADSVRKSLEALI